MSNKRMEEGQEGRFEYMELDPAAQKQKDQLLSKKVKQVVVDKNTTVADLVENMSEMSIQARNIGQCAQVLKNLYADPDRPTVFLGLAGPLIAAGLRNVIKDLIVNKAVDVVVSTGAIIFQDIYA
ncbi:MAG: deoxyhypusine synthase family protein, partial [Candidatus Saganbacteria bacterium]|nr:deoxyhypusine synthase family protein [Candidatus Saganbacteria bacterium]